MGQRGSGRPGVEIVENPVRQTVAKGLERLVKLVFDQIRQAAATTPAVVIRQLDSIRRLAPRLPNACRQTLCEEAEAILETGSTLVAVDRRDLEAAHHRARATLDESSRSGEVSVNAPA